MGKKVKNLELVTDYATDERCVRLHIDLPVEAGVAKEIAGLLDQGKREDAKRLLKRHAEETQHDVIELFFAAGKGS